MSVVHLVDISSVYEFSSLSSVAWQINLEHLKDQGWSERDRTGGARIFYLSHQLPVHGTEGYDPAGSAGEAHQEVPGGGGEGDADGAALQTVGGVTVSEVRLPQTVETNYCGHGEVGWDQSNQETSILNTTDVTWGLEC